MDLISRQDAIEAVAKMIANMCGGNVTWCKPIAESVISDLPSVQPERLTDDDFETIRIHLNAYKEKLCNQQRWKEADEYQRILDRFISFASAQPVAKDINVPVKDCISRQAAIDAFYEMASDIDHLCTVGDYVHVLEMLPSAQPTLYGYNIEHLELIARVLQKENLPPERVVEALTDIGRIVAIVSDEFNETLRKAVEQCMT